MFSFFVYRYRKQDFYCRKRIKSKLSLFFNVIRRYRFPDLIKNRLNNNEKNETKIAAKKTFDRK